MNTRPLADRFIDKVMVHDGTTCWLWGGGTAKGYGTIHDGRQRPAHRVAYELLVGPIPEGLDLDHLCRVRACVNPEHLEPVTRRENLLRGDTIPARNSRKLRCDEGHVFSPDNTRTTRDGGRECRTCRRDRARRNYALKRARAAA